MLETVSYEPFEGVRSFYLQKEDGKSTHLLYRGNKIQYSIDIKDTNFIPKSGLLLCPYIENLVTLGKADTMLDIGTGPCCFLSRHAVAFGAKTVDAIDIDHEVIAFAEKKLGEHKQNIHIFYSNNFENVMDKKYDLIVSNPAQMPSSKGLHPYHDIGGASGRENIENIIYNSKHYLSKEGRLLILAFGFLGVFSKTNEKMVPLTDLITQNNLIIEKYQRIVTNIRHGGGLYNSFQTILDWYPQYEFIRTHESFQNEIYIIQCKRSQ